MVQSYLVEVFGHAGQNISRLVEVVQKRCICSRRKNIGVLWLLIWHKICREKTLKIYKTLKICCSFWWKTIVFKTKRIFCSYFSNKTDYFPLLNTIAPMNAKSRISSLSFDDFLWQIKKNSNWKNFETFLKRKMVFNNFSSFSILKNRRTT